VNGICVWHRQSIVRRPVRGGEDHVFIADLVLTSNAVADNFLKHLLHIRFDGV